MSLLPKEHGAYGQLAVPLAAAFGSAGPSVAGLLFAAAVVAGFLAHEPAAVLRGARGTRARRELGGRARVWLWACLITGGVSAGGALGEMPPGTRWSFVLPAVPAVVVAVATIRGVEKSWPGEVAAAGSFSLAAVPIVLAAGASLEAAALVALPLAAFFVASTLAVRVVILRVRGGGRPAAAAATRAGVFTIVGGAAVLLAWLSDAAIVPAMALVAAAPGLAAAAVIAARPPAPGRLRAMGWALVTVSIATAAIVVVAVRAAAR